MTPAPKRRWFRFSLAMLLMMTALTAALSWAYIERQRADAEAAKAKSLEVEKAALQNQVRVLEHQKIDLHNFLIRERRMNRLPQSDDPPPSTPEPKAPQPSPMTAPKRRGLRVPIFATRIPARKKNGNTLVTHDPTPGRGSSSCVRFLLQSLDFGQ